MRHSIPYQARSALILVASTFALGGCGALFGSLFGPKEVEAKDVESLTLGFTGNVATVCPNDPNPETFWVQVKMKDGKIKTTPIVNEQGQGDRDNWVAWTSFAGSVSAGSIDEKTMAFRAPRDVLPLLAGPVTATIAMKDNPAIKADLTFSPRFNCRGTQVFWGQGGQRGLAGSSGRSGRSLEAEDGESGQAGAHGSHGLVGPQLEVASTLLATRPPLALVRIRMLDGASDEPHYVLVDPSGGSLAVATKGGDGGAGGNGGSGGAGGYNNNYGGSGGNGGAGGDGGDGGPGGSVQYLYDSRYPVLRDLVTTRSEGGRAGAAGGGGSGGYAAKSPGRSGMSGRAGRPGRAGPPGPPAEVRRIAGAAFFQAEAARGYPISK